MQGRGMHTRFWWESQESDHFEDTDINRGITLKCILEKHDVEYDLD
jgi:hypothetical protein